MMDRARRVARFWDWLPTFRAAAEAGQVTLAAQRLGSSPSAVSRAIRAMEDELERTVFDRNGRNVELNPAGEELLAAVRNAMRLIDDTLQNILDPSLHGPIVVASWEPITSLVTVPALVALAAQHPRLRPTLVHVSSDDVIPMLHRGDLDLAIVHDLVPRRRVDIQRLGAMQCGVYAGSKHPLFQRPTARFEPHPFVAIRKDNHALPRDGWSVEVDRSVALRVPDFATAMSVCESSALLAVLPDDLAQPRVQAGTLRLMPFDTLHPLPVLLVTREPLTSGTIVQLVGQAIRATAATKGYG